MGTIAYLDTEMRLNTKDLEVNMARANSYYDKQRKLAKQSKAANDSLFGSFQTGSRSVSSLSAMIDGLGGGMLGAASSTTILATGLGAVAAAGATAAAVIHSVSIANAQLGRELDAQAVAANLTRQDIQAIGYATEAYGISTEKAADILKDFQDKLGDFRSTGGGAFADFFEQVGDKVGLTADQLSRMSGPDALVAVKKAMDDANVSADRQVFYMEALAGDAARLIPLLAENGKQFKTMADRYRDMNAALSDSELEKFKQYEQDIKDLGIAWDALSREAVLPFVGHLGDAARLMFEFLNTSKTERLNELNGDIESLTDQLSNLESGGSKASAVMDSLGRIINTSSKFGGGIHGTLIGAGAELGNLGTVREKIQAELQEKINEKKKLEKTLSGQVAGVVNDQVDGLTTVVDLEQKRLDLIKEQVKAAKSNSKDKDSLYSKLFPEKEKKKTTDYKTNDAFESSAKAASRLINDGFGDGAKIFLAQAEASYRVSKNAGDTYDLQGMKDVILTLRDQAGLEARDIDNPSSNKKSKKGEDGESYGMIKFSDSDEKLFEAIAKNTEDFNKKMDDWLEERNGGKEGDEALKSSDSKPSKKFVLEIKKAGTDEGFSVTAESKDDFDSQLADLLENAASGL